LGVGLALRAVFAAVAAAVRLTAADLPVVDFLAAAFLVTFEGLLGRTGRSLTVGTSLSSDSPDTRPRGSGMDAVDGVRGPCVQPQCIAKGISSSASFEILNCPLNRGRSA
jgi:hypothetical protein